MEHEIWYLRHESGREITIIAMPDEKLHEMMRLGYIDISFDGYHYQPIEEYLDPETYKTNERYSLQRKFLFRPETLKLLRILKQNSHKFSADRELAYHEIIDLAINMLAEKCQISEE